MNTPDYYESCYLPGVQAASDDKPHRCPRCWTVAFWGKDKNFPNTRIILCYRCETQFTRWPHLAWLWSRLGRTYAEPA